MSDLLWGKQRGLDSPYPLLAHLLDTAAFAQVLWDHWLRDGLKQHITRDLGTAARSYVAAAAGLHDVGKANPVFQGQLASAQPGSWIDLQRKLLTEAGFELGVNPVQKEALRNHAQASAAHLTTTKGRSEKIAGLAGRYTTNDDWLAVTALGHHGLFSLPTPGEMTAFNETGKTTWAPARDDITDAIMAACGLTPGGRWPSATPVSTVLISGLVVIADRLASSYGSVVYPGQRLMANGKLDTSRGQQWLRSRYDSFLETLKHKLGVYQPLDDVEQQVLGGYTPRGVQTEAACAGDGVWMVMAPTGAGKTEAAMLRHGKSNERLIFCLPTMATTNAMANRVSKMFKATPNVGSLEHSMRDLFDVRELGAEPHEQCGGLIPSDFLSQGSNRLLGPVSVGTIDQALLGSLKNKFTHLRLLALANAHVVIDEAHLMDEYQTDLASGLFQWWGATNTRVTVLSATLPTWQRDKLMRAYNPSWSPSGEVQFPSHESFHGRSSLDASRYLIEVTQDEGSDPAALHVQWALKMRGEHPQARLGVVVNTVARAQSVAAGLRARGEEVILLHSRMTAKHRNMMASKLEQKAGKNRRGKRFVVVGTQVIEASLDIDLDALSTDLAPAASLIQRAGRVWRHYDPSIRMRRVPGLRNLTINVVRGVGPQSELPYFATELARVHQHLKGRNYLVMPDDSQSFVERSTFDVSRASMEETRERQRRREELTAAGRVKAPLELLVQPSATYGNFAELTMPRDIEDMYTRFITEETATLLIMAPAKAKVPGSWTGSIQQLEALEDRQLAAKAMLGSVPVNGQIARYARSLNVNFAPKSRALSLVIPVRVDQGRLRYDPVNGLRILPVDPDEA